MFSCARDQAVPVSRFAAVRNPGTALLHSLSQNTHTHTHTHSNVYRNITARDASAVHVLATFSHALFCLQQAANSAVRNVK